MYSNCEHPLPDDLENYLLGHTSASQVETIEAHLLVCTPCQAALEEAEVFVVAMRGACRDLVQQRAAVPHRWWQIRIPAAAYAGSFAVLVTLFAVSYGYRFPGSAPESELSLTAMRGGAEQSAPYASAGSTARLHLDATALPREQYGVEVIDGNGDRFWSGRAAVQGTTVDVRIDKRLKAGHYWVRLNGANGVELREFELNVR